MGPFCLTIVSIGLIVNFIKNEKKSFFIIEKIKKKTSSAHLWSDRRRIQAQQEGQEAPPKKIFFCTFYHVNNLFLHQSYLKSPLPVKLT